MYNDSNVKIGEIFANFSKSIIASKVGLGIDSEIKNRIIDVAPRICVDERVWADKFVVGELSR